MHLRPPYGRFSRSGHSIAMQTANNITGPDERKEPNRDAQKMNVEDRSLVNSHMEIVNLLLRIPQLGVDRTIC